MEKKHFIESQEMFNNWRSDKYSTCLCLGQVFQNNILIEKWNVLNDEHKIETFIVEIYSHGYGFQVYRLQN